jgi:uridine monophosphate synthetase
VFDRIAALPYAALPIATAVSLLGEHPYIYPRKEIKSYGTKAEIEGVYSPGERVVILDDLITTGGSKIESIEKLNSEGLVVNDIVVLIDRRSEPLRDFSESGFRLHSIFTLTELLDYWELTEQVTKHEIQDARNFLNG